MRQTMIEPPSIDFLSVPSWSTRLIFTQQNPWLQGPFNSCGIHMYCKFTRASLSTWRQPCLHVSVQSVGQGQLMVELFPGVSNWHTLNYNERHPEEYKTSTHRLCSSHQVENKWMQSETKPVICRQRCHFSQSKIIRPSKSWWRRCFRCWSPFSFSCSLSTWAERTCCWRREPQSRT